MQEKRVLSSKGQVVVPKTIREYLKVSEGDVIEFIVKESGEVVIAPAKEPKLADLYGSLPPKTAGSTENLEKVIYESKRERAVRRAKEGK
jgi:AbrB family looped-hinge helix DNA binding protein